MRILADENVSGALVERLIALGHDTVWIRTAQPGAADPVVLARARQESRVLVTFDKDFGELAFHSGLPAECGIVLVRLTIREDKAVSRLVAVALSSRSDWAGHFSVIEDARVRMTVL